MRHRLALAIVAAALALTVAPPVAGAASRSFTVRIGDYLVKEIGPFHPRRDATLRAAIDAFGRPSSRHLRRYGSCVVKWRRLRLRIEFANFGGRGPGQTTCTPGVGLAQSLVIKGRRFRTWRGLRVGDSENALVRRHPAAEWRRGAWWLRTAASPFGDGSDYPVLRATVGPRAHVTSFTGWIGAAGE
jgi:hypothetical protein